MRLFFLFFLILGLISCNPSAPKFTEVHIEEIFNDSLHVIRDLKVKDANNVWFSSGEGRVGLLQDGVVKLASVRYNSTQLKFKSIAVQDSLVYLLQPTRPALVYKLEYDQEAATDIQAVYTQEDSSVFYNALAFWDSEKGILVGERENSPCLSLVRTMDAGITWEELPCDKLPALEKGEQVFASSNSNLSVFGSNLWIATGGASARVFHTADYGETWRVYSTPFIQGETAAGIFSIDFIDAKNGVAIGGKWNDTSFNAGNKAYTQDGGETWKLFANNAYPGLQKQISHIPNSSKKAVISIGESGIAYSSDKKEWKELSKLQLEHIAFVNDSLAYASKHGSLYKLIFVK